MNEIMVCGLSRHVQATAVARAASVQARRGMGT